MPKTSRAPRLVERLPFDPRSLGMTCLTRWGPRTCRWPSLSQPIDHICLLPPSSPHVCRCARCVDQERSPRA